MGNLDKTRFILYSVKTWPHRLTVRTSAFQAGNQSSILCGVIKLLTQASSSCLYAPLLLWVGFSSFDSAQLLRKRKGES